MTNVKNSSCESSVSKFAIGVSDFSTSEPLLNAEQIVASGMDFIEPGLAKIAAMNETDFAAAQSRLMQGNITVRSVNWFLPGELKVVGPQVDREKSRRFLEHALARAIKLGAGVVVFGSPGSRTIPSGFSDSEARKQIVAFCRLCSQVIIENNWPIKIAVEHVNHTETNCINTFAQALSIVREVDRPEIGLAADFYHFAIENESLDIMLDAGDLICAVQLADPSNRCFPKPKNRIQGLSEFFKNLVTIGYKGGVSVEANVGEDLEADCRSAASYLKTILQR